MLSPTFLFDTNAIIEAVRTKTWRPLTGSLSIETVVACAEECGKGDRLSSGYIRVSREDLARVSAMHAVPEEWVAVVLLHPESSALDEGERNLFAHALALPASVDWRLCSPDLASVRFAVAAGVSDQLVSLEEVLQAADARPTERIRNHFTHDWLVRERTKAKLGLR